jgi:DNA modification methylase
MRDPDNRDKSAYFWTERNEWFSETWNIRGETQESDVRDRSAAYPLEIPLRLTRMFSVQGDTVLDPFWGTGTTTLAAMMSARNSIGVEINDLFREVWEGRFDDLCEKSRTHQEDRVRSYVEETRDRERPYDNENLGIKVMTQDESEMRLPIIDQWDSWSCEYRWLDASEMGTQDTFGDFH